ncbi:hypothetical protein ACQKHM_15110, partial [Brevundimonas sp. NPDC049575]
MAKLAGSGMSVIRIKLNVCFWRLSDVRVPAQTRASRHRPRLIMLSAASNDGVISRAYLEKIAGLWGWCEIQISPILGMISQAVFVQFIEFSSFNE